MGPDLFDLARADAEARVAPLAVRMRPRTLDEVVGQAHLLEPGSPLRRLAEGRAPASLLLWGPPGTGKTTLATLVSTATGRRFRELSAVTAGVKDVRAVIEEARTALSMTGAQTVLFVDEVHRFSKTQQDALLPAVENRWVTLVAATTENPFFSVIGPLLSRSLLLTLQPLTEADIRALVRRALTDQRGLGGALELGHDAEEHLLRLAAGDARRALTALEAAAESAQSRGLVEIDLATLESAVDRAAVRYDRDGDSHYDVISAFIKSMRGGDPDAAVHYLARMLESGEDPRFVARRIVVLASEDIGLADPTALQTAVAAAQTLELVGMPEARLALAQAVLHCSLAPKSNAVIAAYSAAADDVRAGRTGPVPVHLRDKHYAGANRLGHGEGYRYPHDFPGGVVTQQYAPDAIREREYYRPSGRGGEQAAELRLDKLRRTVRGADGAGVGAPEFRPRCTPVGPSAADRVRLGGREAGGSPETSPAASETEESKAV